MKTLLLIFTISLTGLASLSAEPEKTLVEEYRKAHEDKNLKLFLSLVEFAPTTPEWIKEQVKESFQTDSELTISEIGFKPLPPDFEASFEYEGTKYVTTLVPKKLLKVSFDEAGQGPAMITGTTFTIGEKEGVLKIVSAKPDS